MEKQIKIAAKLYECRDTAKRFFREEFTEKLKPYQRLLLERQKVSGKELLECLIDCLQLESIRDNGMAMMMFNAAAVELIDNPDPQPSVITMHDLNEIDEVVCVRCSKRNKDRTNCPQ